MKTLPCAILLLLCFAFPVEAAPDLVVVDLSGLASELVTLQAGIDAVADGGTVVVLPSWPYAYEGPGNAPLDFGGKNVRLWGAYGPSQTFIDCGRRSRAIYLTAANDSTTVIEGFTFLNGVTGSAGAAIRCDGGSAKILDCRFESGTAQSGGALAISGGSAVISRCNFRYNDAGEGGALTAESAGLSLRDCTFYSNRAEGAGVLRATDSELSVLRCSFVQNSGTTAFSIDGGTASIEQSIIAFNDVSEVLDGQSSETFHCCCFGNAGGDSLAGDSHDNIFVDPLLCDLPRDNLSLCSNSECLPSNNEWGLQLGSRVQGCLECDSPVWPASWSTIKSLFR